MTVVIRDGDADDTLESVAAFAGDHREITKAFGEGTVAFFVNDIFNMEDDDADEEMVVRVAASRIDPEAEQNMAVLYFYALKVCQELLKPTGIFAAPDPAPLTARQVAVVFDQIKVQSAYDDGQTIQTYTTEEDDSNKLVILKGAEITVDGRIV